jgi:hypothetical protein
MLLVRLGTADRLHKKNARHEALQFNASDPFPVIRRLRMTAPGSHPPKTLTAQESRFGSTPSVIGAH